MKYTITLDLDTIANMAGVNRAVGGLQGVQGAASRASSAMASLSNMAQRVVAPLLAMASAAALFRAGREILKHADDLSKDAEAAGDPQPPVRPPGRPEGIDPGQPVLLPDRAAQGQKHHRGTTQAEDHQMRHQRRVHVARREDDDRGQRQPPAETLGHHPTPWHSAGWVSVSRQTGRVRLLV